VVMTKHLERHSIDAHTWPRSEVRAMAAWVLITTQAVGWGLKVVLISIIHTHSKKGSELVLHRFTAKPIGSPRPLSSSD
jgi:hypothetical protein